MIAVHGGTHRLLHISRRQRGPERLFSFRRAQKRGGTGYRWHSSSPLRQVIQLSKDLIADSLSSRCWRVCEFDSIAGLRVMDEK